MVPARRRAWALSLSLSSGHTFVRDLQGRNAELEMLIESVSGGAGAITVLELKLLPQYSVAKLGTPPPTAMAGCSR